MEHSPVAFRALSPSAYIQERAEHLQRGIVTFKSSATSTVDGSIWITRSTVCDVMSIITTVAPVKFGEMKDIRMMSKEIKRLRAPVGRTPGKITPGNPLEDGQIVDHEKNHLLNCSLLRKERKEFMEKLRTSRYIRTVVENGAATTLQKYFRRYRVRLNYSSISTVCLACKQLRAALREHFIATGQRDMLVTPMQHRVSYQRLRFASARRIQCVFRKFVSRRVLQYRRHLAFLLMRRTMAVRIQCMARKRSAGALVKLLRTRRKLSKYRRSALLIQTRVRMMFARRVVRKTLFKFRNIAARMIQCWFRAKHSRLKTGKIKELLAKEKRFIAALGLQGLVRRKVARNRVNRLRLRRLYLYVFVNVLRIQSMVRRRLSILRVRKIRVERRKEAKARADGNKAADKVANDKAEAVAKAAATTAAEEEDIYLQVRAGNVALVEKIFRSQRGPTSDPKHTNPQGHTLLTLSTQYGHAALVEKCLAEWGFDVNHRTAEGFNALMLAVKLRHHAITKHLLSPVIKLKINPTALLQDDAAYLLLASLEGLAKSAGAQHDEGIELLKALVGTHGLASSINSKDARFKNMAPIHMAAFAGSPEAFHLVLKSRPQMDGVDDEGHTVLHLACMSPAASVEIVRELLGLESASTGIIVNETKRSAALLRSDASGKDCLILAALAGQSAVLQFAREFVQSDKAKQAGDVPAPSSEIVWTPADVASALRLAEMGDDECLSYVLDAGFDARSTGKLRLDESASRDAAFPGGRTGTTLAMAACLHGNILFVNALLERVVSFVDQVDSQGQTALHYAAYCPSGGSLVAHLLVHECARACGIDEMALAQPDNAGWTPVHVAACSGVELSVDLLARRGMEKAMVTRDKSIEGLTPLLVAAKFQQRSVLQLYLRIAEEANVVDNLGRNALWWFFHPDPSVLASPKDGTPRPPSRPPSSEYLSRKGLLGKISKRDKDEATRTLEADVDTIKLLLAHKCPLYAGTSQPVTPQDLLAIKHEPVDPAVVERRVSVEAGDLLVQELALTAIKTIAPLLSVGDAWRLALGCLRFDDGTCKALLSLLEGGACDVLAGVAVKDKFSDKSVAQLDRLYYNGLSMAAWCVKLGNSAALQQLLRRGLDASAVCVSAEGSTCLHLAAAEGTNTMVEAILGDRRVRIEARNDRGYTAAVEAARAGNFPTAKRLFAHKASMRTGLDGKYWGWMLALARKQEANEKNLQTGRWGDDDERYFRIRVPGWMLAAMDDKAR